VSPGPVDTGIQDRSMPKEAAKQTKAQMTAENPMQRFGDQGEVAKAVVFLAFDATYTTGAELPVEEAAHSCEPVADGSRIDPLNPEPPTHRWPYLYHSGTVLE
jgi:NAD(P)-dependent dehydrogenase (short-subunit alcohol dehydrogenase family)